jgi:hypothetical protein
MTHVDKIDSLIPQAILEAEEIVKQIGAEYVTVKGVDGTPYRWDWFSFWFHQTMNRLCRQRGLR